MVEQIIWRFTWRTEPSGSTKVTVICPFIVGPEVHIFSMLFLRLRGWFKLLPSNVVPIIPAWPTTEALPSQMLAEKIVTTVTFNFP